MIYSLLRSRKVIEEDILRGRRIIEIKICYLFGRKKY
jgi:hypothetical protein